MNPDVVIAVNPRRRKHERPTQKEVASLGVFLALQKLIIKEFGSLKNAGRFITKDNIHQEYWYEAIIAWADYVAWRDDRTTTTVLKAMSGSWYDL